ncbi:MAG: HNH endonuclease signature motif containing protein [Dermatophilaceae bacterium]
MPRPRPGRPDADQRERHHHRVDGTCRFPGCARNARRCEPDHVIPHSRGGPTAIWNLASLCKQHRVKHGAGWKLAMTRDGECTWADPHGHQYATHPINHHELAA